MSTRDDRPSGMPPLLVPDSPEEWDLEQAAFAAANNTDVPEWAREVVGTLWAQYCAAHVEVERLRSAMNAEMEEQTLRMHADFRDLLKDHEPRRERTNHEPTSEGDQQ